MPHFPVPENEIERLRVLAELAVLDTPPEAVFDAMARAAAAICQTPIALIGLLDDKREWCKASVGLDEIASTRREDSFCTHAIMQPGLMTVADASLDPRFANNPLVTHAPHIRFYAGVPLRLAGLMPVGTLCVLDRVPRTLSKEQEQALAQLAQAVTGALDARHAQRAALIDEVRFKAISDASPLGVFAADTSGACIYTNMRCQEIMGLSEAQFKGAGWRDATHPEDEEFVFREWARAASNRESFDLVYRVRHQSGKVLHVRALANTLVDSQGECSGFVGSIEDVTDQVRADVERDGERHRLKAILEGTAAGTWEWNIQSGEVRLNDRWGEIAGLDSNATLPSTVDAWHDLIHPDDLKEIKRKLRTHFSDGTVAFECESRVRHRDGHWVWVLDRGSVLTHTPDGAPEWMFGTHLDISAHKAQENALEKANRRIRLATTSGGIGVWEFDLASGKIEMDEQMRRLYEISADMSADLTSIWFARLHQDDVARVSQSMQMAIKTGHAYAEAFRLNLPGGGVRHLRASAQIARDDKGQAVRLVGVNWDVTLLTELSARLASQHELMQVTLQSIGDAVITTNALGDIAWMNPAAERLTGWTSDQAAGKPLPQVYRVIDEDTREAVPNLAMAGVEADRFAGLRERSVLIARDEQEHAIEESVAPIRNELGQIFGAVLVFHDVTERRRLASEMGFRARHDMLTGLLNRSEFEVCLQRTLDGSEAGGAESAVLLIDLDQFKLVNDACGHAVGDQLLRQVARLLEESVDESDTLARLGGDEFGIILEPCDRWRAKSVARRICRQMHEFRFVHEQRRFRIGTSIGLVCLDRHWPGISAVLQAADASCYAAKDAGRNRVHTWFETDKVMRARHGELQWATRLEQALDDDLFELHAQRIESQTKAASALHAEVLIRLRGEHGELIAPGAFLPAAERFHLISRIDRWVLHNALRAMTEAADLSAVGCLFVNLSGQSVGDRDFHRDAIQILRLAGPQVCARICLEVTETAAITALEDAAAFIKQARALGVRVALDDFGAGASSFGYLKKLNVDIIKIDGQFIKELNNDPLNGAAVRCFVDVARVLGVKTVAEHVEKTEVLDRVREMGVDYAQGFLLHHPRPIASVLRGPARVRVVPTAPMATVQSLH